MKYLTKPLIVLTISLSSTPLFSQPKEIKEKPLTKEVIHIVQRGDLLGKIASKYKVSPKAILELNNIKNPKSLRVGQKLEIPPSVTSTEVIHIVQKGDSLGKISSKYKVRPEAILELNNIKNPKTLRVGQKLKIPPAVTAMP